MVNSTRSRLLVGSALIGALVAAGCFALWHRDRPQRLLLRGIDAADHHDIKSLSANLTALSTIPGHEADVHLLQGLLFLRRGEHRDALIEFGQAPPDGERRQAALLYTGECLYRVGALVEARNCLQTLAKEEPGLPAPHRWLAAIHYDLGSMTDAVAELDQLMRLDPQDFKSHQLLAEIYADAERFPDAIEQYRRALALLPSRAEAHDLLRDLARAQVSQRNYRDALESLDSLDDDKIVLTLRAECFLSLGRTTEAVAALDQAREQSPHDPRVLLLEARIAIDGGKPEAAISPLRDLLSNDPHDYAARYQLAQALQRLGRSRESAAELARMESSRELALRLTRLSQEADELPSDPDVRIRLAETCESLGKTELALMWRKAASALRRAAPAQRPDHPTGENRTDR
ncbi:MAG TPA: tetratricopeptide repeat protein [Planctomycetaceae bacterium]|jgi:tetratricopeptide (TPR) repeat protein